MWHGENDKRLLSNTTRQERHLEAIFIFTHLSSKKKLAKVAKNAT